MLNDLIEGLKNSQEFSELCEGLVERSGPFAVFGITESLRSLCAAALSFIRKRPVLLIAHNEQTAQRLFEDARAFDAGALLLPPRPYDLYQLRARSLEANHARIGVLAKLLDSKPRVVVATVEALLMRLAPKAAFKAACLNIRIGNRLDVDELIKQLYYAGYERVDLVEGMGQMALRGGILDIFGIGEDSAVRIEFFGDEVESLRYFNSVTQRSIEAIDELTILPATEAPVSAEAIDRGIAAFDTAMRDMNVDDEYSFVLESMQQELHSGHPFENAQSYLSVLYLSGETVFDYLGEGAICIASDPVRVSKRVDEYLAEFAAHFDALFHSGRALSAQRSQVIDFRPPCGGYDEGLSVCMASIPSRIPGWEKFRVLKLDARAFPNVKDDPKLLYDETRRLLARGMSMWFLMGSERRENRAQELMFEGDIVLPKYINAPPPSGGAVVASLPLSEGFILEEAGLAVVTENEVFGAKKQARPLKKRRSADMLEMFSDLNVGDYVVHDMHGVGVFQGIEKLTVEGCSRDYLLIQYAKSDRLYVPSEQMDRVQKYVGNAESRVKLSRLGTQEWSRTKQRVTDSIRALAIDLTELYAKRKANPGYAFSADTKWQRQFEDNFEFEETEDQLVSITEIKRDMETPYPMDRLLCGDVGYGKTEVAMRAAFKAVMDSKQVAFLVPTTVLAQQHYNTLVKRFEGLPVSIGTLSRFRTPKEQKELIKGLKEGVVDVVVGTHALLNKSVGFKDLGLLIVDEEQRFGVGHKETIKALRAAVDVLTLSATPIPRTLHMSMVGIRDMSVLTTPPEERFPVQTYVLEYTEAMVADAVMREVKRGGQVYFVYNQVVNIERFKDRLSALLGSVRIGVAHGQMRETQLEKVMMDFYAGEYDVLVCSTIIESGLDVPNVNTIIVYDADRLGLSQLYQLRGRVGRSNRRAYAYLTFRRDKVISEVAEKRLLAIREFTEFGAGFKIAMRDLELRGAGNILGPEQHGHMSEVGYDMYCKLVEAAVAELSGESVQHSIDTTMDVSINAFIPPDYITDDLQKIEVYKRISSVESNDECAQLSLELKDRFGEVPESVSRLFDIALLKRWSSALSVETLLIRDGSATLRFHPMAQLNTEKLLGVLSEYTRIATLSAGQPPRIVLKRKIENAEGMLRILLEFVEKLLVCAEERNAV